MVILAVLALLACKVSVNVPLRCPPVSLASAEMVTPLAVFCTLLGHSVFSWCLKYLAPTYVSTAKLAEPVFASAVAFVLFGEAPGLLQTLGAAVVLWGVCLYARADRSA